MWTEKWPPRDILCPSSWNLWIFLSKRILLCMTKVGTMSRILRGRSLKKKKISFGFPRSALLHTAFLGLWWVGLLSSCPVLASLCSGFFCCGAWGLGMWALIVTTLELVSPQHGESSQTRDWTHVPCIGRRMFNHWTTREVLRGRPRERRST